MKVTRTELDGVLILEPEVFRDERGSFFESFNQGSFDAAVGESVRFVQDNHSRSKRGVLRGLHLQRPPDAQGKLVRVSRGAIFDVTVDLRRGSPTFARWIGVSLTAEQGRQLWIPEGFAHGFRVTSEWADVQYKATRYYAPGSELTIRWNDPRLGIAWPAGATSPILSARDAAAPLLSQLDL